MTLHELIRTYDKETVLAALYEYYPDQIKSDLGYRSMWDELLTYEPVISESGMKVHIDHAPIDEPDDEPWIHVHGKSDRIPAGEEFNHVTLDTYYALEYRPWPEWLGYEIVNNTEHSEVEVVAHILWEMSWAGYTNVQVQDRLQEIVEAADSIETDFIKFTSIDDLFKELNGD